MTQSLAASFQCVSKRYRIGEIGTGVLSHDLNQFWARLRGRPDPYARVNFSDANQSTTQRRQLSNELWALKDIDLKIEKGTALGVIGKNGAGKSTLLKLLASITMPTEGHVCSNGRIVSLLEVGTGFHPELTGRENIFLNGAILGMRRREVAAQLDEIVEFSGCEKFIDTPVKRYSSGMLMRLGFAVAAHLQCEILIVDEVLAVGDAQFQKRCMGKMQSLSQSSERTILFVSHNVNAINALCDHAIVLEDGRLLEGGIVDTQTAISSYLQSTRGGQAGKRLAYDPPEQIGDGRFNLSRFEVDDVDDSKIVFHVAGEHTQTDPTFFLGIAVYYNDYAVPIIRTFNYDTNDDTTPRGSVDYEITIETSGWNGGNYRAELLLYCRDSAWLTWPGAFNYPIEFARPAAEAGGVRFRAKAPPTYLNVPFEWKPLHS